MAKPSKQKALDALNKLNNYAKLSADHRWVSTVRHYIKEENGSSHNKPSVPCVHCGKLVPVSKIKFATCEQCCDI
jgi:hypothetical protein